jgi:hypothetical protein
VGDPEVSGAWGAAAPDPDLRLPTPSGAGRLALVAERPWRGVAVAADPHSGRMACATAASVILGAVPDLGAGRHLPIGDVRQLAFAPGRRLLVTATEREVVAVALDRPRGVAAGLRIRAPGPVTIAVSPGGGTLALAGRVAVPRATLGAWDLERGVKAWTASAFGAAVAAWIDPYLLAVAGRELRLYSFEGMALPAAGAPRGEVIEAVAATPDAIVTASRGTVATVWDPGSVTPSATLPVPAGAGKCLALGPRTLAVGTVRAGVAVALVDRRRRVVDRVLLGVRAAAFADPWLVVTGRAGTAVFEWDPDG